MSAHRTGVQGEFGELRRIRLTDVSEIRWRFGRAGDGDDSRSIGDDEMHNSNTSKRVWRMWREMAFIVQATSIDTRVTSYRSMYDEESSSNKH